MFFLQHHLQDKLSSVICNHLYNREQVSFLRDVSEIRVSPTNWAPPTHTSITNHHSQFQWICCLTCWSIDLRCFCGSEESKRPKNKFSCCRCVETGSRFLQKVMGLPTLFLWAPWVSSLLTVTSARVNESSTNTLTEWGRPQGRLYPFIRRL